MRISSFAFVSFAFVTMLAALALSGFHIPRSAAPAPPPEQTYTTYCAGCHGEKVEAFVDRQWKYGTGRAELVKSITHGYPDNGMPAWGKVLKPAEVEALAALIGKHIESGKKYIAADKPTSNIFAAADLTVRLDTVAVGLDSPWGMAFLPGGEMLVTDRAGQLYRIGADRRRTPVQGVPAVVAEGQGGLLDVVLHPAFATNRFVYLSYSAPKDENGEKHATTAVLRARLDGDRLTDQKVIFEARPYATTRHHYGSRMVFGPDGFLYVSVGDRGREKENPQSLESDCGKVHRLRDDGTAPPDNPFAGQGAAHASVYSYGHRNPQGIAVNPATGTVWTHEHGPRGGDEVNIVRKGKNYGWPVISYGINYDGTTFTNATAKAGMEQPLHYWIPSIAPSGMAFVSGDRYKAWKGNLLVGSLRFQYLNRCVLAGEKIVKEEILLKNVGRVRNVTMAPDGYLYVAVEQPGAVYRLLPVEAGKAGLKQ